MFAALGDATRLNLLARLRDGRPRSIVELTDGLGLTRQGVSKHLRVLEDAGMVRSERIGRESRFVFEPDGLAQARAHLERASRQWDRALERLRALVRRGADGRHRRARARRDQGSSPEAPTRASGRHPETDAGGQDCSQRRDQVRRALAAS